MKSPASNLTAASFWILGEAAGSTSQEMSALGSRGMSLATRPDAFGKAMIARADRLLHP